MKLVFQRGEVVDVERNVILRSSSKWRDGDLSYCEVVFTDSSERYDFPIGHKMRWIKYKNKNNESRVEIASCTTGIGRNDLARLMKKIGDEKLAHYGFNRDSFILFIEKAMFIFSTHDGYNLKFVPDFKVEWVETITPELCRQWQAPPSPDGVSTTSTLQ